MSDDEDDASDRIVYSLAGIFLGIGIPLTRLLWRAFASRRTWWTAWINSELAHHTPLYLGLTIGSVVAFAFLGFLLGRRNDRLRSESKNIQDSNYALSELASTDGLTGLFNARSLHERLDADLEGASERHSPLTCLLIDIDHFKKINDSFGHPFGDVVLANVAKTLKRTVRRIDAVGRLGGEEFMIVMPNTNKQGAATIAERIRQAVQQETFAYEDKEVNITVSVGVVTYPYPGLRGKQSLLKAVDDALYAAKRSGRNRVIEWSAELAA